MDQEILKNRREGMNAYTLWVVAFICTGSVSYGYAASVISITLGKYLCTVRSDSFVLA